MGAIEETIRKQYPESSPLTELAYRLAQTLDLGDGSVAMVKELRSILRELSHEDQWSPSVSRSPGPALDELESVPWEEDRKVGTWINGEKVR
jgi:hypothetical protein